MEDSIKKLIMNPNTKIIAIKKEYQKGFSIYLSISGQYEFIVHHRANNYIYNLLKDGVSFSELKRWTPKAHRRRSNRKCTRDRVSSINHIINVIEEYICEEIAYDLNSKAA